MIWIFAGLIGLVLALLFKMTLLLYAIYAVAGITLLSRWLSRQWADNLVAERDCKQETAEIGDMVPVMLTIKNQSSIPVVWLLVEDLLPHEATIYKPPKLGVHGNRVAVMKNQRKKRTKATVSTRMQSTRLLPDWPACSRNRRSIRIASAFQGSEQTELSSSATQTSSTVRIRCCLSQTDRRSHDDLPNF